MTFLVYSAPAFLSDRIVELNRLIFYNAIMIVFLPIF